MPFPAEDRAEDGRAPQLDSAAGARWWTSCAGGASAPTPRLFAGAGKVDEIRMAVREHRAGAVVFDQALSAGQQRNLERSLSTAAPRCGSSTAPT